MFLNIKESYSKGKMGIFFFTNVYIQFRVGDPLSPLTVKLSVKKSVSYNFPRFSKLFVTNFVEISR